MEMSSSFEVKQTVHNLHNVCVYTGVGSLEVACAPHQADGSSSSSSEAPGLSDRTFNITAAGDTLAILAILGPGQMLCHHAAVVSLPIIYLSTYYQPASYIITE